MEPHLLAALVLSALIGLSLGMLGGGGSILAVPVLVYVARFEAREAIAASLAVVGATSVAGSLFHARAGRVRFRAAALFGGSGMAGAPLGAVATRLVPAPVLLLLFALLMVVVSVLMLRPRVGGDTAAVRRAPTPTMAAAGFAVGLLTGFLGVGGGFLIVPALVVLVGLPMHQAVATSLLVIALNSGAGLLGHLQAGFPLALTAAFTAVATGGALAGTRLADRVAPHRLRRAFGIFVLLVGLALGVRNLAVLGLWSHH
jgi:uncharacterized protein